MTFTPSSPAERRYRVYQIREHVRRATRELRAAQATLELIGTLTGWETKRLREDLAQVHEALGDAGQALVKVEP